MLCQKSLNIKKNNCHNSDIEQFFQYQFQDKLTVLMKGGKL